MALDWGGEIKEVTPLEFEEFIYQDKKGDTGYSRAPFATGRLGLNYEKKQIIFVGDIPAADIIHEMGHVFACKYEPYRSSEIDFFGWEYLLAKKFDIFEDWIKANNEYMICEDGSHTIGEFNKEFGLDSLINLLSQHATEASRKGLLDAENNPIAIR